MVGVTPRDFFGSRDSDDYFAWDDLNEPDQYHDQYAQEDTRAALREARMAGVHPFCITVDPRGEAYLESLFGEVGYIVIERAEALPERLPRIYWRLTR